MYSDDDENSVSSANDSNDQTNISSDPESEWSRKNEPILQETIKGTEKRFSKKPTKSVIVVS